MKTIENLSLIANYGYRLSYIVTTPFRRVIREPATAAKL